jgi:RNA polymerase sigma-70 factor (sigma-E family)
MRQGGVGGIVTDDAAFETFVRLHALALFRTAFLLAGSTVAAEDLVQETLTHLYPQWGRVAAADAPLAYVRRSLANRFVSSRRGAASRDLLMPALPDRWDEHDVGEVVANRRLVWQVLAGLTERQRAALVLRFYHDLPDEEIAALLSCRVATVRSLVSRGMAAVRANALAAALPANGSEAHS